MQESSKARGAQASSSHPTNQEVKQSEFVKLHKAAGLMAITATIMILSVLFTLFGIDDQATSDSNYTLVNFALFFMAMVVMFGANFPQTSIVNLGYLNTIPALQPRIMRFSSAVRKSRTLSH